MALSSRLRSIGLVRWSKNPASRLWRRSSSAPKPLMAMPAIRSDALISRMSWSPSPSGSSMSEISRSNGVFGLLDGGQSGGEAIGRRPPGGRACEARSRGSEVCLCCPRPARCADRDGLPRLATTRAAWLSSWESSRWPAGGDGLEFQPESRAATAAGARRREPAAEGLGKRPADRQPEPQPSGSASKVVVTLLERVEDPRQDLGIDADAGVFKLDGEPSLRRPRPGVRRPRAG